MTKTLSKKFTAMAFGPLLMCGTHCSAPQPDNGKPDCVGPTVTIEFNAETTCDVNPPQILIERNSNPIDCANSGGTLRGTDCEGIDY